MSASSSPAVGVALRTSDLAHELEIGILRVERALMGRADVRAAPRSPIR